MSQVVVAEIFNLSRFAGLFEGIVDRGLADPIASRPHKQVIAVAILLEQFKASMVGRLMAMLLGRSVLLCRMLTTARSKLTFSHFVANSSPYLMPVLSANVTGGKSQGEVTCFSDSCSNC